VLASVGQAEVAVARRPRVGIIATGDELVGPEVKPGISQIRNSNSAQLVAQVEDTGGIVRDYGMVVDEPEGIDSRLKKAMNDNDVVLVSGGVSVGDFDYVPEILRKNNVEILFEKISIKPGKPTVFGIWKGGYCFGLPGNPVATFVVFELLVKPFLYKLMGHQYVPVVMQKRVGEAIGGADKERQSWIPVRIAEDGTVRAVEYHGSADVVAMCRADGLICIDAGAGRIEAGAAIDVRPI
jgi:molybdopterin molybdotransferase